MNKKTIGIVVAILVIAGAGWMIMSGRNKNNPVGKQEKADSGFKQTSLKELEAMTSPQKCTFKDETSAEQIQGLVYISKGKMRGDFGMVSQGKTIKSHMISDGKYSYTWTEEPAMGFKVALDNEKTETKPGQSGVDVNKQMSYDCQNWSEDTSVFVVPSNVKFEDFSALTAPQAPQGTGEVQTPPGSSSAACAACDTLEGDAKTQCRTALSCK